MDTKKKQIIIYILSLCQQSLPQKLTVGNEQLNLPKLLLKNDVYYSCGQNQKLHISCDHSTKKVYTHITFIGNCNIIIIIYRILFAKKYIFLPIYPDLGHSYLLCRYG